MRKLVIGILIGGAVGSTITYFITKKAVEKRVYSECEETICQMREYYIKEYSVQKAEVLKEKEEPSEIVKRYDEYKNLAGSYNRSSEEVDPAETERPTEDAPDEYYEGEDAADKAEELNNFASGLAATMYDKANHFKAPELITEEEFDTAPGFEAEDATYYVEDLTFCDKNDLMIHNEMDLFGNVLDDWKENHEMTDDIFVRNYAYGCDYRVSKMFCQCPRFVAVDGEGLAK